MSRYRFSVASISSFCSCLLLALCLAITAVVQAQSSIGQVGPHAVPQKSSLLARRQAKSAIYRPINQRQRIRWFITSTIGPSHLFGSGTFSAAFGTALDRPKAYGPGWGGFADRFGMRLTGISTGNAMEAGIGALWGEDPRYFPIPDQPFKARVWNAVMKTFEARRRSGNYAPAYARYIAVTGNNFLSNTWREHSEANVQDAIIRTAEGFAGRMAANAWGEFWPDLKLRVVKRKK